MENGFDFSDEFQQVFNLLDSTDKNIFVTGKAGTGKSTLLQYFRSHTRKNAAVLAPTGVAAVNIKGQTIHSFFRFRPDITPQAVGSIKMPKIKREIFNKIDCLLIDEISMVRADLLDCIDGVMRMYGKHKHKPFGGAQMIFFGDLFQLPPVVQTQDRALFSDYYESPYFFNAKVFAEFSVEAVELKKIYRQTDNDFIGLLNSIRNNTVTSKDLSALNNRVKPDFAPDKEDYYISLTTTNGMAERINLEELSKSSKRAYQYEGHLKGEFEEKNLPTQQVLSLKIGAQVMLLNNDPMGRWVNGTIGKVTSVEEKVDAVDVVNVELSDGRKVGITPYTWEMHRFYYNEAEEKVDSEVVGSFTQYPLRLAWAVTIHKSQGKTFSKVIIDFGAGTFSHGQAYVALSRCTNFEGLVLKRPIVRNHIILDPRIVEFVNKQGSCV